MVTGNKQVARNVVGVAAEPRRGRATEILSRTARDNEAHVERQEEVGRSRAVYTADELAVKLGISLWLIYSRVRAGDFPIPPLKVGRRLLWPRAVVDRMLGLDDEGDQ